jgi:hypothetical protein
MPEVAFLISVKLIALDCVYFVPPSRKIVDKIAITFQDESTLLRNCCCH